MSLSARTTFLRPANTKILVFVFGGHSEEGQQHASSEHRNTVTQSVLAPPFLFDWPLDSQTQLPVVDEQLVDASGKMMVLKRLLEALFEREHTVLLFSQFVTMLNLIEVSVSTLSIRHLFMDDGNGRDWALEFKHWPLCRIDGSTGPLERRAEMDCFQQGGDKPDTPRLFLLSTRAGGLGINLSAADTIVFYDQDWVRSFFLSFLQNGLRSVWC
jgi:ATP-dependent DNA helicase